MTKRAWIAVLLALAAAGPVLASEALINLEWRPAAQTVNVGDPVNIGLYAVCDPGATQLFRAADIVFAWDPGYLHLLGIDNTGAVPLLASVLPANDPYNLNGPTPPPTDGDGYYRAWASLGQPLTVTAAGSLLTTFKFTALAQTPQTVLSIPVSGGNPVLYTRILGSPEAGTLVTGTLGAATVVIRVCRNGDFDSDGDVDLRDFASFQICFTGAQGVASSECACVFDFDTDHDVDFVDFGLLSSWLTGPQ